MFGIIYKIQNIQNGKIYIGQTIRSLNERLNQHKCDAMRRNREGACNGNSKKVRCVETDEIFECLSEASSKYGMSVSIITMCCKGQVPAAKKLHWEYVKE